MVDIRDNWDLYKTPSDEILQSRRAFYSLRRRPGESNAKWLKRVQECIGYCEFPLFVEFLLIDRFICGLNANELESIRSIASWTFKQLLDFFSDVQNVGTITKVNGNQSLDIVKFESVSVRNLVETSQQVFQMLRKDKLWLNSQIFLNLA